jgi:hypothetical protein
MSNEMSISSKGSNAPGTEIFIWLASTFISLSKVYYFQGNNHSVNGEPTAYLQRL